LRALLVEKEREANSFNELLAELESGARVAGMGVDVQQPTLVCCARKVLAPPAKYGSSFAVDFGKNEAVAGVVKHDQSRAVGCDLGEVIPSIRGHRTCTKTKRIKSQISRIFLNI
jgi:hypothetical protein